jgi:hypothetical protein
MDMEDFIRQMEELDGEELYEQWKFERPRYMLYEGPLSVQEDGSFWGLRLDGVSREGNFPEDCIFLEDIIAERFNIPKGKWTEPATNRFRITVEKLDDTDG